MIDKKLPRILIVDDDESCLASLRRVLRGHYDVLTTKDPMQALKLFELNGPFAVVISDYQMPFINGIELFARIYAIDNDVQRIMLTGYADLQMAIDAVNHGRITAFLTKPMPIVSIRTIVSDAVRTYTKIKDARILHSHSASSAPVKQVLAESYPPLTVKEKEVLSLLAKGYSNDEISLELSIAVGTVKTHINNLFGKLEVNSRLKLVSKAIEAGFVKN